MKNILIILILIVTLLFLSCGTILDSSKIVGRWELINVEYYQYNEDFDSYKKITAIADVFPDDKKPTRGQFFDVYGKSFIVVFDKLNQFSVTYTSKTNQSGTIFCRLVDTDWSMDTSENSLTIKLKNTPTPDPSTDIVIWKNGLTVKNYWPMSSSDTFEIYIKAKDVGLDYFNITLTTNKDLSNDDKYRFKFHSVKAFFKRQI
ncbi:MAG: hypothetical protein A2086_12280 [Spirochaetes bacterium GWD1_27_9]|nr:MAG: hypothetical protein A2Z98_06620 [Spirochaetes bacterium GWB1_27_13]OHD21366.1 MAG: hypothetical protein A2Y34_13245 [Spirochaetes bacterium GWC1_27_15]OHD35757.1 MAG: hypothetical protein A2086_12280 [Spirochaetes bacterium GWD1_27_9]